MASNNPPVRMEDQHFRPIGNDKNSTRVIDAKGKSATNDFINSESGRHSANTKNSTKPEPPTKEDVNTLGEKKKGSDIPDSDVALIDYRELKNLNALCA